ncbi:MAG: hypothetical protein EPO24_05490, partial [Bacteroidetes bacterium]
STVSLLELYSLTKVKGANPLTFAGLTMGVFVLLSFYNAKLFVIPFELFGEAPNSESQFFLLVLLIAFPVISIIELFRNNGSALMNVSTTMMGVLYVSFCFGTLIGLREIFIPSHIPMRNYFHEMNVESNALLYRWGGYTVVAVYAMIWLCDSAAYYVGSAMGKHKLFPRVSPNKSWEGAIAGFIFAVVAAVGAKYLFLEYLHLNEAIILGAIVGVFGQIGDLFESLLKRDAGVKDSSNLIPGHGGVLDRFDSLLFVSPIVYFYLDFIVFSLS